MIIATTISGILVFTGVILILVLMLNFAQSKLLPQEEVFLTINDKSDETINVAPGSTLLSALSGQNIFLPSASLFSFRPPSIQGDVFYDQEMVNRPQ